MVSWTAYLASIAPPRDLIDRFLTAGVWTTFDPELGYLLHDSSIRWGLDDTSPIETFAASGARSAHMYAGRTPRITCYGDSFTECMQVGDGETWEEYLAGHFAEPVGNYGVGGYGVYQAYRRMLRHEAATNDTELVVLYVWGDDSLRSILSARWLVSARFREPAIRKAGLLSFHSGPWPYLAIDLDSGLLVEHESIAPTAEALYRMCDPDFMVETFRDDDAARLRMFVEIEAEPVDDLDRQHVDRIAEILEVPIDRTDGDTERESALRLLETYAARSTNEVVDRAVEFTASHGSQLLVVLNFTDSGNIDLLADRPVGAPRGDALIVDHLAEHGIPIFDMNLVHRHEHEGMNVSYREYMARYMVDADYVDAHYSARGNHLFAYGIKDAMLPLLDPPPVPYRVDRETAVDFAQYSSSPARP